MSGRDGDAEDRLLLSFLDAQRERALAVVGGLSDDQLATSVLPSGWTPLGLIEHLGHAERHWFQQVAEGFAADLPWPDDDGPARSGEGFTTPRPADVVFAFYRDQVKRSNAVLAAKPLSAAPVGRHGQGDEDQVTDLRFIVLHMLEETARHLGHLDAARELIDGSTGLGQDDL
ncbi:MAG: DinB family protein [Trebonia sp.]